MSHLAETVAKVRVLLTGATPEELVDTLRNLLRSGDTPSVMAAIEVASEVGASAAPLIDDLAALMTSLAVIQHSDAHLEGDSAGRPFRFVSIAGNTSIAWAACEAIIAIGVAPRPETLAAIAAKPRFAIPLACFDQGAYIGDYASETIDPAELVARIRKRLG
jgi:hypothetical protein